jgi:phage protein D
MRDQTVVSFLMERARLHAYSVFRRRSGTRDVLYFGPSEPLPDGPYTLEWGKTLLDFRPVLRVGGEARSAAVRFWDRGTRQRLTERAKLADFELNEDLHPHLQKMGEDKEVVDRALRTRAEARELARATVRAALKGMLDVTASTIGLPDLRAGQVVRVTGVDYRFDGRYFVTQTTHTIDSGGYRTTLRARREQTGAAA